MLGCIFLIVLQLVLFAFPNAILNAHNIFCDRHVGALGLVWCVAFWFIIYESPDHHPRITKEEYEYISYQIAPKPAGQLGKTVSIFADRLIADS